MKIAVVGKGGVGKTTVSGVICRTMAKEGRKVLAIDGDPNPNLSAVLGVDKKQPPQKSLSTDIIERVQDGESWRFRVKMPFDEVLQTYSQDANNVTLLVVGKPEKAGTGCMCGSHTVVRELIHSALTSDYQASMVVDTEASLEHMKRGTSKYVEKMYTVLEPYYRSLEAASRFAEMAKDLGIREVAAIGNKIKTQAEANAIREYCDKEKLPIAMMVPYDENIAAADLKGVSIVDYNRDSKAVKVIEEFVKSLKSLN